MALIPGLPLKRLRPIRIPGLHGFDWGFIALEYYALILNRVVAVLVTPGEMVVVKVGGLVMAHRSRPEAAEWYENPMAYVSPTFAKRYASAAVGSAEGLRLSRAHRRVPAAEIHAIGFEPTAKWGLGNVPYSGRIFVAGPGRRDELILLGKQNGDLIAARLRKSFGMPDAGTGGVGEPG